LHTTAHITREVLADAHLQRQILIDQIIVDKPSGVIMLRLIVAQSWGHRVETGKSYA